MHFALPSPRRHSPGLLADSKSAKIPPTTSFTSCARRREDCSIKVTYDRRNNNTVDPPGEFSRDAAERRQMMRLVSLC